MADINRELERREVVSVTDAPDKKLGEKTFMYCSDCDQERIFVWSAWSGEEYYGYPPEQEYGWKCSACGSKFREPSP